MRWKIAVAVVIALLVIWLVWMLGRDEREPAAHASPTSAAVAESAPIPVAPPTRPRHVDPSPELETVAPPAPQAVVPTLVGRVIDADGNPVAGASIVSHPDDLSKPFESGKVGAEGSRTFVAKTGTDGRFALRVDPKGVQLILTATGDAGFGQVSAAPTDKDVEIKLIKWTLLTGRVTNQAKEPVADAKVTMHVLLEALMEDYTAVTDSNGEYRIERLPPIGWSQGGFVGRGRRGTLIAEANGYAPLLVDFSNGLRSPPGASTKNIDLVLVRGLTLSGKVVDGDTKAPIAGATVVCWSSAGLAVVQSAAGVGLANPWSERSLGEMRSGVDGTFRFEHLPAKGPSGVSTSWSGKRGHNMGFVAAWKEGYVYGGDEIPVSSDETTMETTIELWPSATVTGRVVDPSGNPVAGVRAYVSVDARRPSLNGFPSFYPESAKATSMTDADGRYSISDFRTSRLTPTTGKLSAGTAFDRQYFATNTIEVTATGGEVITAPDLTLDLTSVLRVAIVVADEFGRPVAGAMIGRELGLIRTGLDGRAQWAPGSLPRSADPATARQTAIIRARGFAPQQVEFTPTRGSPVEVTVVMRPGARISGRVLTSDGGSAAKASIVVGDGTKPVAEAVGDGSRRPTWNPSAETRLVVYANVTARDDGTFEITDLPDGPYHVAASMSSRAARDPNQEPKQLRDVRSGVLAGATDLVFTIPPDDAPPTQPLELVVMDDAGAAVEKCNAQAVFGGMRFFAQVSAPTKLRFDALPPGTGVVTISAAGWTTVTLRDVFIAHDSAPSAIEVKLDRGITLRGIVRTAAGALPLDATLVLTPFEQSPMGGGESAKIRKDGSFEATGFLPGRYRAFIAGPAPSDGRDMLLPAGGELISVPERVREVVLNLTFIAGGALTVSPGDKRLPPLPFGGAAFDAEKARFGAASRCEVIDAFGAIVATQSPVFTSSFTMPLIPGEYIVRLHLSGEAPQDKRCTVKAGERCGVRFAAQ